LTCPIDEGSMAPQQSKNPRSRLEPAAIAACRELAAALASLHQAGRWHGSLPIEFRATLDDAPSQRSIEELSADALPPTIRRRFPRRCPTNVEDARVVLEREGIALDPRTIDLWQLGRFLCRVALQTSPVDYLQNPSVRSAAASDVASAIDRLLAVDGKPAFTTAGEAVRFLERLPSSTRSTPVAGLETPADRVESADLSGESLGPFRLIECIGRGGMGEVYRALDAELDRTVAVKVLPSGWSQDQGFIDRFRSEAAAAAKLSHPNVVSVHRIGNDRGRHFFAMQYVDGESLAHILSTRGRLSENEAVAVLKQCLDGLSAAHSQGLVHRDVKPSNILVERGSGRVLLVDFGLAKSIDAPNGATSAGVVVGTPDFLSPEQALGAPVDARSDLYSLGIVAHRMLSGRLPFHGDTPQALLYQHVHQNPPSLESDSSVASKGLAKFVRSLLEKDPSKRPGSAKEASERLARLPVKPIESARLLESHAVDAPSTMFVPGFRHEVKRHLGRWQRFVRRIRPDALSDLEDARADVEDAVTEQRSQRDRLRDVRDETQRLFDELAAAALAHRSAAGEAAVDALDRAEHWRQFESETAAAEDLERQRDAQKELLESASLSLAQADVRLDQLRSERDLLLARLRAAEAQAVLSGRRPRNARRHLAAGGVAACLLLMIPVVYVARRRGDDAERTAVESTVGVESPPSNPAPSPPSPLPFDRIYSDVRNRVLPPETSDNEYLASCDFGLRGGKVSLLAFSPTTTSLATVDEFGEIRSQAAGSVQTLLNNHRFGRFNSRPAVLAMSPDGKHFAVGGGEFQGSENPIAVYDARTGRLTREIHGHAEGVRGLCYSSDGASLFSGDSRTLRRWNPRTEEQLGEQTVSGAVAAAPLACHSDGRRLLLGGRISGGSSLVLWDWDKGGPVHVFDVKTPTYAAQFLADGRTIVSVGQESIDWRDAESGAVIHRETGRFLDGAFSMDGRRLVASGDFNTSAWDASARKKLVELPTPKGASAVAVSRDGRRFAVASRDNTLLLRNLPPVVVPGLLSAVDLGEAPNLCVAVPPSGSRAFVVGGGGRLHSVNLETYVRKTYEHRDLNWRVAASPSEDHLAFAVGAVGAASQSVRVETAPGGYASSREQRRFEGFRGSILEARFCKGGRWIVAASQGGIVRWSSIQAEQTIAEVDVAGELVAAAASSDGETVVLGGADGRLHWVSQSKKKVVRTVSAHRGRILALALGNGVAVSSGQDQTLKVWPSTQDTPAATFTGHRDAAFAVALTSDGRFAASGGADRVIRIWGTTDGRQVAELRGHLGAVRSLAATPDGKKLVSAGDDPMLRVWDLAAAISGGAESASKTN
jgi:serine/threonine protein kinase/WD40 repeat protein